MQLIRPKGFEPRTMVSNHSGTTEQPENIKPYFWYHIFEIGMPFNATLSIAHGEVGIKKVDAKEFICIWIS